MGAIRWRSGPARHVGGHELPPGSDIPGSKVLRRASDREAFREADAYFGDEQPFEVQNAVNHGAALAMGAEVDAEDVPDELKRPAGLQPPETAARTPRSLQTLSEMEHDHILRVLYACGGSHPEAARVLGIARNTLWRKLRAYS